MDELCIDHGQKGYCGGYGRVMVNRKRYRLHVYVLMQATGYRPEGMHALHSCDNPRCINPSHLRWGTHSENMCDRNQRGRTRGGSNAGERNGNSKLSDQQTLEIKALAGSTSQTAIAERFGVSKSLINKIIKGTRRGRP